MNQKGLDRDMKCRKTKDQKILPMFELEKILFAQFCILPKLKDSGKDHKVINLIVAIPIMSKRMNNGSY